MSKPVNLIYRLEGRIEDGVDVFDLAPLLLSIGEIIQEGNKVLFPNGKDLAVNIKPFKEGSFIIDIALLHKDLLQAILDFTLNPSNDAENIKELLKALGIIGGEGVGLVQLVKFLKGKIPSLIQLKDGRFIIFNFENKKISIDQSVHKLYTNPVIGQEINRIGKIISTDNIEKVESYIREERGAGGTEIRKEDAEYLKQYTPGKMEQQEKTIENKVVVFLNPKRGSFEGEGNSWSFRKGGHREEIITATIKDNDFLKQIESGRVRLVHTDLLKVEMLEKQKVIGNEVVSVTNDILKVIDYVESPKQIELFGGKEQ